MDRGQDALILVISSHGSKDAAISVSNGALPLNDLTGKDLKEALDEAGIRWGLVIIANSPSDRRPRYQQPTSVLRWSKDSKSKECHFPRIS